MIQGNITVDRVNAQFPDAVLQVEETSGDVTITLEASALLQVCRFLRDEPDLQYDLLLFVTGVDRLDMGIEPFLVASSVEGIVAQRLVRGLCKACRQPVEKIKIVAKK